MAELAGTQKKSGIKVLNPGEVLFSEGDFATSMFIIQKGQMRLFRSKGKGFIELAVLRSGEVLGEMSYFDPESKIRSASVAAISKVEVIEISFLALEKTMTALNPWFKTLINTLAERLRKSNERVRSLESNSVGFSGEFKFFQGMDIVKIFSILFFCFKSLGEHKDLKWSLSTLKLKSYAVDIFAINEAKLEEFIQLLTQEKIIEAVGDQESSSKILYVKDPESFRVYQAFFNTQRSMKEDKKLNITPKGEKFLMKVLEQVDPEKVVQGEVDVDLSLTVDYFKEYNLPILLEDFQCARKAKFCGEYRMDDNGRVCTTLKYDYVKTMLPVVKIMNAINNVNAAKANLTK